MWFSSQQSLANVFPLVLIIVSVSARPIFSSYDTTTMPEYRTDDFYNTHRVIRNMKHETSYSSTYIIYHSREKNARHAS